MCIHFRERLENFIGQFIKFCYVMNARNCDCTMFNVKCYKNRQKLYGIKYKPIDLNRLFHSEFRHFLDFSNVNCLLKHKGLRRPTRNVFFFSIRQTVCLFYILKQFSSIRFILYENGIKGRNMASRLIMMFFFFFMTSPFRYVIHVIDFFLLLLLNFEIFSQQDNKKCSTFGCLCLCVHVSKYSSKLAEIFR